LTTAQQLTQCQRRAATQSHGSGSVRKSVVAAILVSATLLSHGAEPLTPAEHRRGPEQTFLTFPEWYLVHSPAEYAAYLQDADHPSRFPLFAHIGQFWQGYAAVSDETRAYPFNAGYHLMVSVIGASTTVEYGMKGLYEHTVGRLSEATRTGGGLTPEERLAAKTAQDYVDFIRVDPWYLFDFQSRLEQLWQLPLSGPNTIRRLERRFALTSEYLVKEGYARLIKLATHSIYEAPKPVTAVVLDRMPSVHPSRPEFKILKVAGNDIIATIPRYEAFTDYSRWLAAEGVSFREIAGNRGEVVLSLLVPIGYRSPVASARVLFSQPILTRANQQRVVLAIPVGQLSYQLRLENDSVRVEHVYDF
jgi:hypothetical protein